MVAAYEEVSTQEFPHPPLPTIATSEGSVKPFSIAKVAKALRWMKPGKATGPDDLAAELWQSCHWNAAGWLAQFFNQIAEEN